jgi:hypothetical protein
MVPPTVARRNYCLTVVVLVVARTAPPLFVVLREMLPLCCTGAGSVDLRRVTELLLVTLLLDWLMLEPAGLLTVTPLLAGPLTVPGVVWAEA